MSDEDVLYEIMSPAEVLSVGYKDDTYDIKGFDYNMKYYRAPLDRRDARIDRISPLMSIRWDIDSYDWSNRDSDKLYEIIMDRDKEDALDRQIVILHDAYSDTADIMDKIIKELAGKGYQFLNMTEYLELIDFDFNKKAY